MNLATREAICLAANKGRGGPILSPDSPRETLIRWLTWNDRNGSYTDEDARAEGMAPLTLEEAWDLLNDHCV